MVPRVSTPDTQGWQGKLYKLSVGNVFFQMRLVYIVSSFKGFISLSILILKKNKYELNYIKFYTFSDLLQPHVCSGGGGEGLRD